jgi:hypothetical protein
MEFYLPEYTWEEFLEIAKKLLQSRYELNEVVANKRCKGHFENCKAHRQ